MVKNCGSAFHAEIATKAYMDDLHQLAKTTTNDKMKAKIAELIQIWAHAWANDPSYRAVQDTLKTMKDEGFKFPPLQESGTALKEIMFSASTAPTWLDGDACSKCYGAFTLIMRKHHCRNCGQVFCDKCSSKVCPIPKYGMNTDVRVCDDCFDKLNTTKPMSRAPEQISNVPKDYGKAAPAKASAPVGKTEQELREEEELEMALALSKSEAEAREKSNSSHSYPSYSFASQNNNPISSTATPPSASASSINSTAGASASATTNLSRLLDEPVDDPELSKYLNREYWEQQKQRPRNTSPAPSAPATTAIQPKVSTNVAAVTLTSPASPAIAHMSQEDEERERELQTFSTSLRNSLEMFVNRMNSNKIRGRPIANDSSVQSLFIAITNMHSHLVKNIQEEEDKRLYYESLQDKLNEIKDSRAALDALREEYREKKRRDAEELEAQRQQQMARKLEIMRQKKQEYLQYQRQVALQQLQDQERELLLRKQQQKYAPVATMPQAAPVTAWQPTSPQIAPTSAPVTSATAGPLPAHYSPMHVPSSPYGSIAPGHPSPHVAMPPASAYEQQAHMYNQQMYQPMHQAHPAGVQSQLPITRVPQPQATMYTNPPQPHLEQQTVPPAPVQVPNEVPEAPLISFD